MKLLKSLREVWAAWQPDLSDRRKKFIELVLKKKGRKA